MKSSNSPLMPTLSATVSSPESQRSRPVLLPAFEPVSSSPPIPRPAKRKFEEASQVRANDIAQYPTPVPTSSTGIITSSSPQRVSSTRPPLQRTASGVSERVPLGDVSSIEVPADGQAIAFGRSSNSSQYQLSANRLISRIHVKASYKPGSEPQDPGTVLIQCLGWNGAKIHCRGRAFELGKGDTFSADRPDAEIMLDVQDARVLIRWPMTVRNPPLSSFSELVGDEDDSPERATTSALQQQIPSSPPAVHLHSPVSPSPRTRSVFTATSTFIGLPSSDDSNSVQVYEDDASEDGVDQAAEPESPSRPHKRTRMSTKASQESSALSSPESFSDRDEENDPIITSFGPFGENLLPRMASFNAASPENRRAPLRTSISPRQPPASKMIETIHQNRTLPEMSPIRNHVINQLAFSRLHALPLGTIMNNLPLALKQLTNSKSSHTEPKQIDVKENSTHQTFTESLKDSDLKQLLDETPCVGEISREGKDASGKQLENEFYYIPEMDTDEMRKTAVESSLGKPGLRAVRKQHKQYFWKRPRH